MPLIENNVDLQPFNTFGLPGRASRLVRVRSEDDVRTVIAHPELGRMPRFILGGGSNVVLTGDVDALVVKAEVPGRRLVEPREGAWIVETGAGESWHALVEWSLAGGLPGLENPALIPGTVGRRDGAIRRHPAVSLRTLRHPAGA